MKHISSVLTLTKLQPQNRESVQLLTILWKIRWYLLLHGQISNWKASSVGVRKLGENSKDRVLFYYLLLMKHNRNERNNDWRERGHFGSSIINGLMMGCVRSSRGFLKMLCRFIYFPFVSMKVWSSCKSVQHIHALCLQKQHSCLMLSEARRWHWIHFHWNYRQCELPCGY